MDAQQIRLRELASAIATGDAVFFVGAGLSRGAGAPSWDELVTLLRQQLSPASTEPSLSLVAQFYRNQHGEHKLYAELRRLLQQRPLRVTPSHQLLISLPSNVFVTTNYDSLIEDALHGAGRPVHVVADDDELALWNESVEPQVLKVHGDLQRSSTIVFTEEDYLRFLQMNRAIHRKLLDLFSFRTIVFVGYSMRDFDISQVLSQVSHELGSARRPAYLLTFEADAHLWRE